MPILLRKSTASIQGLSFKVRLFQSSISFYVSFWVLIFGLNKNRLKNKQKIKDLRPGVSNKYFSFAVFGQKRLSA